jgi:hypothetical protein
MTDHDEVELYRERLPALVDWLKGDQIKRAVESGQPIINITINEAPRPAPPAPPEPNIATKYAGHLVLATWSAIVFAGIAVVFVMIAEAIMIAMISLAVCAIAIAAAVRSLRMSKEEAKAVVRGRQGRR